MINLTDPKIAIVHGALTNVLANRNVDQVYDYFTEDAVIIINEKKLQGRGIYDRIEWLKNNSDIKLITVTLHTIFFDGNQGFDHHTSEVIYTNNTRAFYKIFGYTKLRDQRICHYEDLTIQIDGEKNMEVVAST